MNYYEKRTVTKREIIIKSIVFVCICTCFLLSLFFADNIEKRINHIYFDFNFGVVSSTCKIHYIDVGQGDCTFIELPDNKSILIDTGASFSGEKIKKYLKAIGKDKNCVIDYLILTHTDSDHIGNAKMILDTYQVKNVYMPKVYSNFEVKNNLCVSDYNINTSLLWEETCLSIYNEVGLSNRFYSFMGSVIESDEAGYSLVFYSPFEDKITEANNYSPIMVLSYGNSKFMFVGDIESSVEEEFLSYYNSVLNNFDVDVLKVSHHGSKNSTTNEFLQAVKPEYAVISCGNNNSYAHPNNETIDRLINNNCKILRTDTTSSIVFGVNSQNFVYQTSYDFISSYHFCWWYVVVSAIVISGILILCFKIKG